MIQTMQTSDGRLLSVTEPANGVRHALSAAASLVPLEEGLYALTIGDSGHSGKLDDFGIPRIQVSAPAKLGTRSVEILGTSGCSETWLGSQGATVLVKAPPGGGHVVVTAYAGHAQLAVVPDIEIQRLDRPRANGAAGGPAATSEELAEVRTEIVLHIERSGDRRFPGQGWVGNRGRRLRIEAFSIRPIERLAARDIEFKALGPNRQQTPWVSDAKLCGTRGQGMPLTGFALRLAPQAARRYDIVYSGAFFDSGVVGPCRNGEICEPPIADDPLEALNVQVIRRGAD